MNIQNALFFAQISDVAYHLNNPSVYAHHAYNFDIQIAKTFNKESIAGFIGSTEKFVLLAFRGTVFPRDDNLVGWLEAISAWISNGNYTQKTSYRGMVHSGFTSALDSIWEAINQLVREQLTGNRNLWITGHSLGGALAVLAASRFLDEGLPVAGVYTYGSPRVGDQIFANHYKPNHYRIEYGNDIVPHLPPPPVLMRFLTPIVAKLNLSTEINYKHTGKMTYLSKNKSTIENWPYLFERLLDIERIKKLISDPDRIRDHKIKNYIEAIEQCPLIIDKRETSQVLEELMTGLLRFLPEIDLDNDLRNKREVYLIISKFLKDEFHQPLPVCLGATHIICKESDPRLREDGSFDRDLINEAQKLVAIARGRILAIKVHYEPGDLATYNRKTEIYFFKENQPAVRKVEQQIDWDSLPADVRESHIRQGAKTLTFKLYAKE